jgi:transposase-like protein
VGERVLGIWFQRTEGAKFCLQALLDVKQGGVQDVLACCVDGLTGFSTAIEAAAKLSNVSDRTQGVRPGPRRPIRACFREIGAE